MVIGSVVVLVGPRRGLGVLGLFVAIFGRSFF